MYIIVHISSGIVAASFYNRQYAVDWAVDNNIIDGEPAMLYRVIKQPRGMI